MSSKISSSILDVFLFRRLMQYVRPYSFIFVFVLTSAIFLSAFSTLNPYLLKITVDDYITLKDYDGMLIFIGILTGFCFWRCFSVFVYLLCKLAWTTSRLQSQRTIQKNDWLSDDFFDKSAVDWLHALSPHRNHCEH